MMREFHMPEAYVMDELPLARAFAYRAWAVESQPWAKVERASDGYISQEIAAQRR